MKMQQLTNLPNLSIGQVAAQSGVAASTIRYYEKIGLLPPPPRISGQRRYQPSVLEMLGVIRLAQQAGLTIAEIQQLLHDFPADVLPAQRWQRMTQHKLPQLDAQMHALQAMKATLVQTLQCECDTLAMCGSVIDGV